MIIYIILFLLILFGAMPFQTIELIVNAGVTSINTVLKVLWGFINALIQFFLGIIYGLINFGIGGLYNVIADFLPIGEWEPLVVRPSTIALYLPPLDLSDFVDPTLSPIGIFLNTFLHDTFLANATGAIALGALAILLIIIAWKSRSIIK